MVKIKNIKGALVEYKKWPQTMQGGWMTGFNDCIDQQGEIEISISRENLARVIHDKWNPDHKEFPFEGVNPIIRKRCFGYADAIILALPELLEVVK